MEIRKGGGEKKSIAFYKYEYLKSKKIMCREEKQNDKRRKEKK